MMNRIFRKPGSRVMGIILIFILYSGLLKCQEVKVVSMTKYLSNCLYNFSRNINWPVENKSGDFIIAIVGNKELYNEMIRLTQNMKVGMQPIQIRHFSKVGEISGYQHIVFVDDWQSSNINLLIQKISESKTLIVTETEGLIGKGSMINFVSVNGMMQFEMDKEGLKKSGLMSSSVLEKMARTVN